MRTSAKRASSFQKSVGCSSDQRYRSAKPLSLVPRRELMQSTNRVRLAAATRAGEGRQTSLIALQPLIVGPGPSFGSRPVDDLVRVLDVAGLAVDAIGRVDLQTLAAFAV